jgi:hypothetical protein
MFMRINNHGQVVATQQHALLLALGLVIPLAVP